jgi:hypothetical protein
VLNGLSHIAPHAHVLRQEGVIGDIVGRIDVLLPA